MRTLRVIRAREAVGDKRAAFVREVLFGSRTMMLKRGRRGEKGFLCIAQVSLLLRCDSKRQILILRVRSAFVSRSVAIADADPIVGARKTRRLKEGETILSLRILRVTH